ncbi:MAG: TldD/PmbA family protein [Bacteroidales bacterium]
MSTNPKDAAVKALEVSLAKGCQAARICLNISAQSSCSVRNDKLDRLQQSTSSSLYIQLFVDGRYGTFSTNRTEPEEVANFIGKGIEATRFLTPDPCRSLPDKALYYTGGGEDLRQYDSSGEAIEPKQKLSIAFGCSAEVLGKDKRVVTVNSEYGDSDDYFYMIDSQGFDEESHETNFTLSAECSVKGRGDARPEAWWYEGAMFFDKLKIEGCGTKAMERALNRLNPIKLKSGKYNMVIENTVSSRFVSPVVSALNGSSIQQNNSFLKDMLGKQVFSPHFTLFDNAHLVGAAGSRYYDGEGVATKPINIIEDGVINTYFINTYNSKKLGLPVTVEGPSVLNCYMDRSFSSSQEKNLDYILSKCGSGIFVTGFNGGNSNSSTGDFSYGVEGFFFENGKISHPIKEMNVSGNIITLWNNIVEIGTDPRNTSRWLIPTLAFESVDFSGK